MEKAEVTAFAILDETSLTLGDVSDWRVGDLIPLKAAADTKIRLDCKGQSLFWCELGQAKGHYTLKMADRVDNRGNAARAIPRTCRRGPTKLNPAPREDDMAEAEELLQTAAPTTEGLDDAARRRSAQT